MTYVTRWDLAAAAHERGPCPLLAWMPSSGEFARTAGVAVARSAFVEQLEREVGLATASMSDALLKAVYVSGPDFYWVPTPEEAFDNEKARGLAITRCLMVAVGADPFGWSDDDAEEESEDW